MEVEPASKGEEGQEEEGTGPATVKEEGVHLENGEPPEENEESAGTDSGQELGTEGQNLRSGTYGDRTESKAYGSVIHKCEVRGPWAVPALSLQGLCGPSRTPSCCACRTAGRSSRTQGTSNGTSASTRARNPSHAASAARLSRTPQRARLMRRHTGTHPASPRLSTCLGPCSTLSCHLAPSDPQPVETLWV